MRNLINRLINRKNNEEVWYVDHINADGTIVRVYDIMEVEAIEHAEAKAGQTSCWWINLKGEKFDSFKPPVF